MTSELVVATRYRFGRTRGDMAAIPVEMVSGVTGERDEHRFRVFAPDTRPKDTEIKGASMLCGALTVEVRRTGPIAELDERVAFNLTVAIVRDVFMQLALIAPNLGFPGSVPELELVTVTLDGQLRPSGYSVGPIEPIRVPERTVSMRDIREAATGICRPSLARRMVAEAGNQVLFNSNASKVTAVIVAASACEVAAHARVRELGRGHVERLISKLLPKNNQSRLSPADVIDLILPILTGRRLSEVDGALWRSVTNLIRARNVAVHQGTLPAGTNAILLVDSGRRVVEWIEALSPAEAA